MALLHGKRLSLCFHLGACSKVDLHVSQHNAIKKVSLEVIMVVTIAQLHQVAHF